MKRCWIEYGEDWLAGPMTYWVHVEAEGEIWPDAKSYAPPAPRPVAGRGFPRFHVEWSGEALYFSSLDELKTLIDVLGRRVLPTSRAAASRRLPATTLGPNRHWLSRLPAGLLPRPKRQRLVRYLGQARNAFERELGGDRSPP